MLQHDPAADPIHYEIRRTYTKLGQPESVHLVSPDGQSVALDHRIDYAWNEHSQLASVKSLAGEFVYGYDAKSPALLTKMTGPVHSVETSYEPHRNLVTGVVNKAKPDTEPGTKHEEPSTLSSYTYANDLLGRRDTISQGGEAFGMLALDHNQVEVAYNDRSEVVGAVTRRGDIPVARHTYAYDGIGNRRTAVSSRDTGQESREEKVSYEANALNQYAAIDERGSSNPKSEIGNPKFDPDGNLLEDARNTYTWNADNNLVRVDAKDGSLRLDYIYDHQSRRTVRVETSNPGRENEAQKTTYYLYDDWNLHAEIDAVPAGGELGTLNFEPATLFTWGRDLSGSLQGAGGVGGLLAISKVNPNPDEDEPGGAQLKTLNLKLETLFPTYDANGNVGQLINESGAVVAAYAYDPFGNVAEMAGAEAAENPWRFSTKPVEAGTGWLYYGYRWYDAQAGRWVNRDPIEESGGVNLYGFVGNGPTGEVDLIGLSKPEKNTREQCVGYLNAAKEDPTVKKLLAAISNKEGCTVPNMDCEDCCATYPSYRTTGAYYSGSGADGTSRIRICFGGDADKGALGTTTFLRHELVHAYDACEGNLDCEAAACSEVRAYRLMGGKRPTKGLFPNATKQTIRKRALNSLMKNSACGPESERAANANNALDLMLSQCYEDFSPLF